MSNRKHRNTIPALWVFACGLGFAGAPTTTSALISPDHPGFTDASVSTDLLPMLGTHSSTERPWACASGISLLTDPLGPWDNGEIVSLRDESESMAAPPSRHRKPHPVREARPQSVSSIAALHMPIAGAIVTSPYGWREHPILKRRRFHKGVDFGAPQGTPVLAAQDGIVEEAGWRGHYGYYLRIRHSGHLETAYAHLALIDAVLKPGSAVRRGQVVTAVGQTGWATGPHLYYEVIVDGRRINPLSAPLARSSLNRSDGGRTLLSAQSG